MVALELGQTIDNLMILTADVSTSAGLERFKRKYSDKYLDVGIAEQNLMCVAAGLASEDYRVITTTFAPFQTMRCCEQIKVNLGYMRNSVCMVGLASGIVLGTLGYTHCCIEDLSVMRAIPGITVISPADCGATAKAVMAAMSHKGPTYIRLTGGQNNPIVYKDDFDFEIGKAIKVREGKNIVIIATGTMVSESLGAANILEGEFGISAAVIDMHTIKPIDNDAVDEICERYEVVVTVEEHSIIGGLGSAIADAKSSKVGAPPQITLGLPDNYGHGGEYRDLLDIHELTSVKLADRIRTEYQGYQV
jgi:transketolase